MAYIQHRSLLDFCMSNKVAQMYYMYSFQKAVGNLLTLDLHHFGIVRPFCFHWVLLTINSLMLLPHLINGN